jgi:anaerobic selenocysteine-containing dehydrogenase
MLCHDNYDVIFNALAVRNVARVNAPVFDKPEGALYDWEIFNGLGRAYAKAAGVEYKEMPPPMAMLSAVARRLADKPHGADLGPLQPSLLGRLETPGGKIQCAPAVFVDDLARVRTQLVDRPSGGMRLVGRRHLRSNNSWMHNAHRLVKGPRRDQLWVNPSDAARLGIAEGAAVTVRSRAGSVSPTVHVTDRVPAGVVCLPHGFSQRREGVRLSEASRLPGESYNDLSEETAADAVSGNAAFNALPVELVPAA